MLMPNRSFTAGSQFRYGFNGKENDNDVKGTGNQQDYGMRIYDPRIGKFLSVDPLTKSFPWYTPYQFAGNIPIAAIDLDGEEQKIMINWFDANGNVTKSKLVKFDFINVNKLYNSLRLGLNSETTYTLEGTKFNSTNAKFSSGFEEYRKGTGNPRNPYSAPIRPKTGILTFNITTNDDGSENINITYKNSAISMKEVYADAIRGFSSVVNVTGTSIEALGYGTSALPGAQEPGLILIGIGKGVGTLGDGIGILGDLVDGKKADASKKFAFFVGGLVVGKGIAKLPLKDRDLFKESLDTYLGKGIGFIKDGYFDNCKKEVQESNNLDIKIETKKK
ncbi:RHS repeat domain-containing protein [Paraflavitalea sp. sgz302552]